MPGGEEEEIKGRQAGKSTRCGHRTQVNLRLEDMSRNTTIMITERSR